MEKIRITTAFTRDSLEEFLVLANRLALTLTNFEFSDDEHPQSDDVLSFDLVFPDNDTVSTWYSLLGEYDLAELKDIFVELSRAEI
jgi:hypothetical protein